MSTIRKIAEYTNLSPSTVSIVLNGKSVSRNISEKTVNKVLEAAKELGYTPNISARRLRNNNTKKYIVVFWANDFRAPLLFEFIKGMQQYIEDTQTDTEIVLKLFTPDLLYKALQPDTLAMYSSAVICTASNKDLEYLEMTDFTTPIVLYNRFSKKYSNVLVQNHEIGKKAAELFAEHNKKNAVIFTAQDGQYIYSEKRMSGFMKTFSEAGGITTVINAPQNSMRSGYDTIKQTESMFRNADCVFCLYDVLAISYLDYLRNTNLVSVPENQEIISIGTNDNDTYESLFIPLSIIKIPISEMGKECMRMVIEKSNGDYNEAESKIIDFVYTSRLTSK
ncbi:LacI family DNA-binding transcriptional regulator [Anaerocolumna sp. AGMB13025]|uniref:LacI family DNA-binding transcriptional regulator n=1 Tax=Anaerocolumna sp. AGMB13025 TaxID=3039116 RepID=UPI00241F75AE|nr:LacI family DNA-binding transcriptional regulator [Anaerocolumna sp. AGMB13025]WFR55728.1 LacI family DNA-binding transcriptional regulator [Anaerocolumna sp. AGMB13025]